MWGYWHRRGKAANCFNWSCVMVTWRAQHQYSWCGIIIMASEGLTKSICGVIPHFLFSQTHWHQMFQFPKIDLFKETLKQQNKYSEISGLNGLKYFFHPTLKKKKLPSWVKNKQQQLWISHAPKQRTLVAAVVTRPVIGNDKWSFMSP